MGRLTVSLAALCFCSAVQAADYQPRDGHWQNRITIKDEKAKEYTLVMSSASYPATCANDVLRLAEETEKSNGYVWSNKDHFLISWKPSDLATLKHEVIGIGCTFEAAKGQ